MSTEVIHNSARFDLTRPKYLQEIFMEYLLQHEASVKYRHHEEMEVAAKEKCDLDLNIRTLESTTLRHHQRLDLLCSRSKVTTTINERREIIFRACY